MSLFSTNKQDFAAISTAGAPGGDYAIELVDISKFYAGVPALENVTLNIVIGEFLVLLGPSGCGKSTILKIVAGLEDPSDGEVYISGKLVNFDRPAARNVAMVFQNYALYPHMTVAGNIGFPLRMHKTKKSEIAERVESAASLLGLDAELHKYPEQLSGGQRQRVALGRAIVRDPVAFLMDEPLSNLDALLRVQMRTEVLKLHRALARTTVYVTHDQIEAMTMATRIVVLDHGRVQQIGSPAEIYLRPQSTFVATFVGSPQMNLLSGAVRHQGRRAVHENGSRKIDLGAGIAAPEGAATLGIRPDDILLAQRGEAGTVAAAVGLIESVGSDSYLNVDFGEGETGVVRVPSSVEIAEGEQISVAFPPERIHLFDPSGARLALEAGPDEKSSLR